MDGDDRLCDLHSDCSHVWRAFKTDLLIYSTRAASEGGIQLFGHSLRAKRSRWASFTLLVLVERSYMMATNSSKTPISFPGKLSQSDPQKRHTSVAFSNTFQV